MYFYTNPYIGIYNSIENDLLKDWKHSEILITIIAIWIFYRFIKSIDCYKIRHMFTRRKTTVIDPNIMKRMEQYWIDKLTTGIETWNGKLPDEPWDEQKIINTISELAKVSLFNKYVINNKHFEWICINQWYFQN